MKRYIAAMFALMCSSMAASQYVDEIRVGPDMTMPTAGRQFVIIDSFPSPIQFYSMGLAFDGQYLWNDDAFICLFQVIDTSTGSVIKTFTPTLGDRDMTFDGQYLWVTNWESHSLSKYDTSNCSIIALYYPPFYAGSPNGLSWDGTHLWVGEESGRIYQMTTSGDTVRSIPSPCPHASDPRGLAFDGEFLWVGHQDNNMIYKIDTICGTVLESYIAPGAGLGFQQGLAFDGQYLWSTCGVHNWIYKIEMSVPGTPDIALSSTLLDFESVIIGESAYLQLAIYNLGHGSLILSNIFNSLAVFTNNWNPLDSVVLFDDSLVISVTFTPNDTVFFSDTLWIDNNDSLCVVTLLGTGRLFGIDDGMLAIPKEFALRQPIPNPCKSHATLQFELPKTTIINLSVYDITGRLVATLVNGRYGAGVHEVTLDASDFAPGVYFCYLEACGYSDIRRVVVLE